MFNLTMLPNLPVELINKILIMRPNHETSTMIKEYYNKCINVWLIDYNYIERPTFIHLVAHAPVFTHYIHNHANPILAVEYDKIYLDSCK